jgi:hypothetical protein
MVKAAESFAHPHAGQGECMRQPDLEEVSRVKLQVHQGRSDREERWEGRGHPVIRRCYRRLRRRLPGLVGLPWHEIEATLKRFARGFHEDRHQVVCALDWLRRRLFRWPDGFWIDPHTGLLCTRPCGPRQHEEAWTATEVRQGPEVIGRRRKGER